MDIQDALQIVIDLAKSAMAEENDEPEAYLQHKEALDMVEDLIVNRFGDD